MTTRQEQAASRKASVERVAIQSAQAVTALRTNRCPDCGAHVHVNLALTGWVQCDRSGSGHFRRDPSGSPCSWQGFVVR